MSTLQESVIARMIRQQPNYFLALAGEEQKKLWGECSDREQKYLIIRIALFANNHLAMIRASESNEENLKRHIEDNRWLKILGLMIGEYKGRHIELKGLYTESPIRDMAVLAMLQITRENVELNKLIEGLTIDGYSIETLEAMRCAATIRINNLKFRRNISGLDKSKRIELLCSLSELSPTVTALSIESNNIDSGDIMSSLVASLPRNGNLQTLRLNDNFSLVTNENAKIGILKTLSRLPARITKLDLGNNSLNKPKLLEFLIGAVLNRTKVTNLALKNNEIGNSPGNIAAIAIGLRKNFRITQLDLRENGIERSPEGMEALAMMVEGNHRIIEVKIDYSFANNLNNPELRCYLERLEAALTANSRRSIIENCAEEVKLEVNDSHAPGATISRPSSIHLASNISLPLVAPPSPRLVPSPR